MNIRRLAVPTAALLIAAVPASNALAKTIKPKTGAYGLGTPNQFQLFVKGGKITTLQVPCGNGGFASVGAVKIKVSKTGSFKYNGNFNTGSASLPAKVKGKFTSAKKVKASIAWGAAGTCADFASMTAKFAGAGG